MPHADLGDFEKDPDINKLGSLFTVRSVVAYLDRKVNG
jgi:hypothetical protein